MTIEEGRKMCHHNTRYEFTDELLPGWRLRCEDCGISGEGISAEEAHKAFLAKARLAVERAEVERISQIPPSQRTEVEQVRYAYSPFGSSATQRC